MHPDKVDAAQQLAAREAAERAFAAQNAAFKVFIWLLMLRTSLCCAVSLVGSRRLAVGSFDCFKAVVNGQLVQHEFPARYQDMQAAAGEAAGERQRRLVVTRRRHYFQAAAATLTHLGDRSIC